MDSPGLTAEPGSAAEKRAFAVAKLKRAASLPRMKDGRRPPMHVEAVSEGEKRQQEDTSTDNDTPPLMRTPSTKTPSTETVEKEIEPPQQIEPTTRAQKRRSRSRSRSRGSKDMRGKNRPGPTPSPMIPGDSSPEATPSQPYIPLPSLPPVLAPIPSHYGDMQRSRLLRSPTPASPESSVGYPGTSPPTPMLPSLEALQQGLLQQGLFRSNSAGSVSVGRMMAMHKLTNGTDKYEPLSPVSPLASNPPFSQLGRNNTVSGGERTAARKNMLTRIGGRITRETDGSGEDGSALPQLSPKRRRRRSRKSSGGPASAQPVVDLSVDTPLPQPSFSDSRARSATPNHTSSPDSPSPVPPDTSPARSLNDGQQLEPPERPRRRSVVVEEEEDDESRPYAGLPATPKRVNSLRMPHVSDAPSYGSNSTESASASAIGVPVFLSQKTPSRQELFPSSPFPTPLKELPRDDDEEQVLYPAESHNRLRLPPFEDREISWIASPVPQMRSLVDDGSDSDSENDPEAEEDFEREVQIEHIDEDDQPLSSPSSVPENAFDDSPRASANSKLVVESETSPEISVSQGPHSPSSIATMSHTRDSQSPQLYPARLTVASRMLNDRSPLNGDNGDREERSPTPGDIKRNGDGSSTSAWEKIKTTFSRSGSTSGRRSRTNSLVRDKRDYDSSASRESGGSQVDANAQQQQQQQSQPQAFAQLASASASTSSLAAHASPILANSSVDLTKYHQDSKLFPFPGMKTLQAQRSRNNGFASASNPDMVLSPGDEQSPHASTASTSTPPHSMENGVQSRPIVQQVSDSHLLGKYNMGELATAPSPSPTRVDYFNMAPHPAPPNGPSKLPMNLPGVKQWLSRNKIFSSTATSPTLASPPPVTQIRTVTKKSSLSDLLHLRKAPDMTWDDVQEDKSRTPTGGINQIHTSVGLTVDVPRAEELQPVFAVPYTPETDITPKTRKPVPPFVEEVEASYSHFRTSSAMASPNDPPSSATPDPTSSLDDGPAQWTSDSSSIASSSHSFTNPMHSQGQVVIEKLEENLARGSKSPMWASAIDEPPRKLVLSSPVLQVVNPNTVKDRFLFLFTDILVIAKPIMHEQDSIMDSYRPNPVDRKFVVKNVVLLRNLKFNGDRVEPLPKSASYAAPPRNPLIRQFVHQFATKDVDLAVSTLLEKAGIQDDHVALGQILFKTLDLDRSRLGDYLSRKTSKLVLKTFVDSFGFTGIRPDNALRVFLHSINIPARTHHNHNPLEYLLDAFAGRWYEANAGIVAYDKDLAIRLVRTLVQLNDVLHDGISQEPGPTHTPRHKVSSRDFLEAFRRYDPRYLVSDDALETIYNSIAQERLSQAPHSSSSTTPIMIKRVLPVRLTYKVQSDPIILRIPQADPNLTIALYGQGLIFDPPFVTFKTSEVAFRVLGTSLGPKTMIMCRSGPNALNYSGLPLSNPLLIERAFMRNTFQAAFLNHRGVKRRYMFSVDDPLIRYQWTVSLKQRIDNNMALASSGLGATSPGASKFHRAAEHVAFKVLQDTLIGASDIPSSLAIDQALRNLASSDTSYQNGNKAPLRYEATPRTQGLTAAHVRSKSRSQVYHRIGAGQNELDLNNSTYDSRDSRDTVNSKTVSYTASFDHFRAEDKVWSSQELEMHCQQNSSIALVLSFMQVGSP